MSVFLGQNLKLVGFSCAFLILGLVSGAFAERSCKDGRSVGEPKRDVPVQMSEFRRAGAGLVCTVRHNPVATSNGDTIMDKACYNIGGITIGMQRAHIEQRLGQAQQEVPQDNGIIARMYPIKSGSLDIGYYVVFYQGQKAVSVQTSLFEGEKRVLPVAFSSISVGDATQQVIDVLGPPQEICTGSDIIGQLWSYGPYDITFEVVDGHVFSTKLGPLE